mmetsp:Transcript_34441/g.93316  ORF Transcript_34441/g.93316 Transcript_34441/m.93316 type:complete len:278 (-) Transcript_34441:311-1144(-)
MRGYHDRPLAHEERDAAALPQVPGHLAGPLGLRLLERGPRLPRSALGRACSLARLHDGLRRPGPQRPAAHALGPLHLRERLHGLDPRQHHDERPGGEQEAPEEAQTAGCRRALQPPRASLHPRLARPGRSTAAAHRGLARALRLPAARVRGPHVHVGGPRRLRLLARPPLRGRRRERRLGLLRQSATGACHPRARSLLELVCGHAVAGRAERPAAAAGPPRLGEPLEDSEARHGDAAPLLHCERPALLPLLPHHRLGDLRKGRLRPLLARTGGHDLQ